jgi:hypothetical protein
MAASSAFTGAAVASGVATHTSNLSMKIFDWKRRSDDSAVTCECWFNHMLLLTGCVMLLHSGAGATMLVAQAAVEKHAERPGAE